MDRLDIETSETEAVIKMFCILTATVMHSDSFTSFESLVIMSKQRHFVGPVIQTCINTSVEFFYNIYSSWL